MLHGKPLVLPANNILVQVEIIIKEIGFDIKTGIVGEAGLQLKGEPVPWELQVRSEIGSVAEPLQRQIIITQGVGQANIPIYLGFALEGKIPLPPVAVARRIRNVNLHPVLPGRQGTGGR